MKVLAVFGYNLIMGYKTYETDRYGRLTVYPSLDSPGRKLSCRKIFIRIVKAVVRKP